MDDAKVHPETSSSQTQASKNSNNDIDQRNNFVEIPLESNQDLDPNIGDDVTNAQNLKFQLSCFEKFTSQIVDFTLILLHIREKQNQKEYNALQDLKLAKTNCQTTASKIQFNEAVDRFVLDRISNPSKYIV